jgi:hypothetical protein
VEEIDRSNPRGAWGIGKARAVGPSKARPPQRYPLGVIVPVPRGAAAQNCSQSTINAGACAGAFSFHRRCVVVENSALLCLEDARRPRENLEDARRPRETLANCFRPALPVRTGSSDPGVLSLPSSLGRGPSPLSSKMRDARRETLARVRRCETPEGNARELFSAGSPSQLQ